jgi:hypothetical protein
MKPYVNLRWALAAALLPLVLAGLFVLVVQVQGLRRYDPAYFSGTYAERYDTPGAVARALEGALQTNDRALLAELQGLRRLAAFKTSPKLIFVMLWEHGDRYISYLYFEMDTYKRHVHYVEQVGERWIVSPPDAYYYLHSGRWLVVFTPLAIVWWLLEIVVTLAVLVYRLSARLRVQMYGS